MNDSTDNEVEAPDTSNEQEAPDTSKPGWFGRLKSLFRVGSRSETEPKGEALVLPPLTRGMQAFSMLMFFVLGGIVVGFVVGNPLGLSFLPGAGGGETREAAAAPAAGEEQLYQCPMHPEVIELQPGECPICQMELMRIKPQESTSAAAPVAADSEGEREILYWYAPMDPTYMRSEPGLSPMGMKLMPKYADEVSGSSLIEIDPVQVQNIGVVSTRARMKEITRSSKTVGILDFNADRITWINTKFEGWIEKVHVNYVGQDVTKGQPLFEIYSPELVTTQEEYLRALEYKASFEHSAREGARRQAESLLRSTRDRLTYWDISEEQIETLERTRLVQRRLTVLSPVDGVVAQVMDEALEGMHVRPGMDLYKIADLSTVWVHADVYESDLPWIREQQPAVVSFRNDPERVYRGGILFLYPEVSRDTRTLKICVEVPNPERRLRPGMYADVVIKGPPLPKAVVIPQSSVIRTGERDVVFVDLGEGRFQSREVKLGIKGEGDDIQVLDGINAGELVVTQAQFMFDSESRIQEAIAKFMERGLDQEESPTKPASEHGH
jgi:Cu(I)/Ag(I) efflux system membrane fusion protein/cobalt-zinc-cadmium efflux system membrane fusion protein